MNKTKKIKPVKAWCCSVEGRLRVHRIYSDMGESLEFCVSRRRMGFSSRAIRVLITPIEMKNK